MTREEAIANLKMIRVAFVDPGTKEKRKLVDDTFAMAIQALENHDTFMKYAYSQGKHDALSQEPITTTNNNEPITIIYPTIVCDDAISRDMALKKMADYVASGYADSVEDFENYSRIICQLPSVTQKSGKWINDECGNVICSECKRFRRDCRYGHTNYCNHCGARMESEDKE